REQRAQLKRFLEASGEDESAIERLDAPSIENDKIAEIIARLDSPSLFAPKKLVMIRNLSQNDEFSQKFIDWLELQTKDDQQTEVLIINPNLDGRSKIYKELKAKTDFREYLPLKEPQLSQWVLKQVNEAGGSIETSMANYLVELVGPDQQRLASEIEKLLLYEPKITRSSIDLLVEPGIDSTTFQLADAAFARNDPVKALRLYQEQRKQRIEPVIIIGSLAWQLHLIALVKSADANSTAEQIANESGFNAWPVSRAMRLSASISHQDLVRAVDKLALIDSKSKSAPGYNIDDALQYYLLSI
ncbi:MAG: DNA polymerase III subunit delta, partial [Candidatus Saccharimonadales bacterium]